MLPPEYLWSIADSVVNIYDEMNNWAVKDMIERIMAAELYKYDKLPGTARYRAWMLNQAGMHYEEMAKVVAVFTEKSEEDIKKLFIEAGLLAIANDFEPFDQEPYDIREDARATQLLQAAYDQTNGELYNYTRTTMDRSQKLMIDTLDKAYFEVSTGAKSYSEAIRDAIDTVASVGCEVEYPNTGHVDSIETAVRRAVLTGVNQGTAKISLVNCEKLETDYVIVDAHTGARYDEKNKVANHLGWQGKVYKIHGTYSDGTMSIPNLEAETGFPSDPLGLCGYNCRHSFYPFMLGIDNPDMYKNVVMDEEESKREYDLSQKQREKERNIRKTRRMLISYKTAIDNCKDEKTKFEMQLLYDKTAVRLRKQNKSYNDFCKEHDLQKEAERIKVANWNREQSNEAVKGANRYNAAKEPDAVYKSKFSNNLIDYNNGQKDIINHRSIEKELNKSDVGKEVIKYLEDNPTNIYMCYKTDFNSDMMGFYDPVYKEIFVDCTKTQTIKKTAEIIVHEVTHKRLDIGGDLKSEVICIMHEYMHKKRTNSLTAKEIRSIIKSVKEMYPEYKDTWKRK